MRLRSYFLVCICSLLLCAPLYPNFVIETTKDGIDTVKAPLGWGVSEWQSFGLLAGAGFIIYQNDNQLRGFSQSLRSPLTDSVADLSNTLAHPVILGTGLGFMYLLTDEENHLFLKETSGLALKSLIIATGITQTAKLAFHRHRPYTEEGPDTFDGISGDFDEDTLSFPSGHTSAAFAVATVFADRYADKGLNPVIPYGLAALAGLSRMNSDKHWASDVFVGGVIGYYTAKSVLHLNQNDGLSIRPFFAPNSVGAMLTVPL